MKAIILFTIVLSIFFSGNIYSQKISSFNEKIEDNGQTTKEYIRKNKSQADVKTIFQYNAQGNVIERAFYLKENTSKWIPAQKHIYEYNDEGKIANIIFTRWNETRNEWEKKSLHLVHLYNNGQLIVQEIVKNTNTDKLLTVK